MSPLALRHTPLTHSAPHIELVVRARTTANTDAHRYVSRSQNYVGSNTFGTTTVIAGWHAYVVYSFRTPILAWIDLGDRWQLWANECRHSGFTGRHRSGALRGPLGRHYAFGHDGSRGDGVWRELAARVADKHGVGHVAQ